MTSTLRPSLCSCLLLVCVLMTATRATPLTRVQEYDPDPQYSFAYDVHDAATGDIKSQQESRQGSVVRGSYSLVEPDGSRRTVHYTADPHRGFQAVVHREANTQPVRERPAVHQVRIPLQVAHNPVETLHATPVPTSSATVVTAVATPAPGIRPAPASITRPVLQYIGVRPSYRFTGAPYYQLRQRQEHVKRAV